MKFLNTFSRRRRVVSRAVLVVCIAAGSGATVCAQTVSASGLDFVAITSQAITTTPELDLRITYEAASTGNDGVRRSSIYSNRVYRRTGQVWIERVFPEALRESLEHGHEPAHGPHAGHAHDDARAAPLSVKRGDDGKVQVEVVLAKLRRVISVDEAHHGNVGWGGSFENAYWMVPPASLRKMERVGSARGGVQRYRSVVGEHTTLIDWDVANQFARRIERSDAHGLERIVVTAAKLPLPLAEPWKATQGFERGDYSDLLD
ncbi:hypothetical protein [Diaphorobacter aerolatus]|uniref:hypothetical protein n=1 Tax=Diaphorobacter aerolatus TaxID=1288495 RepID=UPI001D021D0C|nr:hypothetical protein [Diaphorobacter aerolatus]